MIGQTISHYKILERLGEGGMGVVYKAQDTTLDRIVALKFLPPHLHASEPDKARFIQEAKAASAMNHPNICTIYAIGEHDHQLFIAMEFVDGQTLRDRRGTMSFRQGMEIGIQIADGLAAAHAKGIVHRDIKPENIMIRKDGIVQVMDFGLAKLGGVSRLTREGSTVGTAGYMSPEQVQGQDTDHRSDIFSFGVLMYELLSGQLPFKGVHETALSYEIVNVDPEPMASVKPEIDPEVDRIILECMEKDPAERYQSIAEVAKDLRRVKRESSRQRASRTMTARPLSRVEEPSAPPAAVREEQRPDTRDGQLRLLRWSSLVLLAAVAALVLYVVLQPREQARSFHAELLPPPNVTYNPSAGGHIAISPDGSALAFGAVDSGGKALLWVRPLQSAAARPLPGTDEATYPFWSPDGKSLGFFARGKLFTVDAGGGTPFTVCDVVAPRGGTWNRDGVIIFAPDQSGALYHVSALGGKPVQLTHLDTTLQERTHRWPVFLPDNDHYLFFARGILGAYHSSDRDHLFVGSLSSGVTKRLFAASSEAAYADGMILYVRDNCIVGQSFDLKSFQVSGDPVVIAQNIQYTRRWSKGFFSVSQNGVLVYQSGGQESRPDLLLVHRDGSVVRQIGSVDVMWRGSISPDGKRIAMDLLDPEARNIDVWIYDVERKLKSRLTFAKSSNMAPIWSPHGDAIIYSAALDAQAKLTRVQVSGSGREDVIATSSTNAFPTDWSSDNKYILYSTLGASSDIWVVPLDGDRTPRVVANSEFDENAGRFSPDVHWIAYVSNESGKGEVYIRSFIPPGTSENAAPAVKRQISVDGGVYPVWREDGKGVFYVTPRGIMVAELKIDGSSLDVVSVTQFSSQRMAYFGDISQSGDLILTQSTQLSSGVVPLRLVVNWKAELAK